MGALDRSAKVSFTRNARRGTGNGSRNAGRYALTRVIILGTVNDKALIIGFISEDASSIEAFFVDVNGVHGTIVIAKR